MALFLYFCKELSSGGEKDDIWLSLLLLVTQEIAITGKEKQVSRSINELSVLNDQQASDDDDEFYTQNETTNFHDFILKKEYGPIVHIKEENLTVLPLSAIGPKKKNNKAANTALLIRWVIGPPVRSWLWFWNLICDSRRIGPVIVWALQSGAGLCFFFLFEFKTHGDMPAE